MDKYHIFYVYLHNFLILTINFMFRLPIPFPHVAKMSDPEVVAALLKHLATETAEFFYGKSYPVFKSLHGRYYTDCAEVVDFINEIYIDILSVGKDKKKCKLENFHYECSLKNWVGIVAIRFCYTRFRRQVPIKNFDDGDRKDPLSASLPSNNPTLDREDVEKILSSMTNKRYSTLIRLRYLEGHTHEETADLMDMTMENYYNKHRLAKVQYLIAYRKEMER